MLLSRENDGDCSSYYLVVSFVLFYFTKCVFSPTSVMIGQSSF